MINDQSLLDVRKALTGKDGKIFVTIKDETYFLAEAESFSATLNLTNTDIQPMGSILSYGVPVSASISITLSEIVVRDDVMLTPLIEAIREGYVPTFDIQSVLDRNIFDGQESRQTFRNCIPTDSVQLMNITPGEVIKREWNFRGNALPEVIKALAS